MKAGRLFFYVFLIFAAMLASQSAHSSPSRSLAWSCKDFLSALNIKPSYIVYEKCEVEQDRQGKPLKAVYRVAGVHALKAEAFLVRLAHMPRLRKSCCQWDGPPGQFIGKDGRTYMVYMTSPETGVKYRKHWRKIASFQITVRAFTEEI